MSYVVVIEDVFAPQAARAFPMREPLIEWMVREMPPEVVGDRAVTVFRDGAALPDTDDWSWTPREGEAVAVLVTPAEPVSATIGTILINIAISLAVSVALTALSALLFPAPSTPRFAEAPAPSPVYSVSIPANEARLGQPLPVVYGTLITTPDLAMQPYAYFLDGEQYVCTLLCVTAGRAVVSAVYAGESNLDALPNGVAEWRVYGPDDHGSTHGAIAADWPAGQFSEDMVTSPDVTGQVVRAEVDGEALAIRAQFIASDTIRLFAGPPTTDPFEVGSAVTVAGSASNNAVFTIAAVTEAATHVDLDVTSGVTDEAAPSATLRLSATDGVTFRSAGRQVFQLSGPTVPASIAAGDTVLIETASGSTTGLVHRYRRWIDSGDAGLSATHELVLEGDVGTLSGTLPATTVSTVAAGATFTPGAFLPWLGWFGVAGADAQIDRLSLDLEWPAGLYQAGAGGEFEADTVQLRAEWQAIDDTGAGTGAIFGETFTVDAAAILPSGATINSPLRLSKDIAVTAGRYRVRLRRLDTASAEATDQSQTVWLALRGRKVLSSLPVYGPVTLVAVRLKASAGLSQQAAGRIRVELSRQLPRVRADYDEADVGRSRNPGRAVYDMAVNADYGIGADPSRMFDLATLGTRTTAWATAGLTFDHVFTDAGSVWDAMRLALQPALAEPLVSAGKITPRQEGPKTARRLLFSPANVLTGTMKLQLAFSRESDADGVRVIYRDQLQAVEREALFPAGAVQPRELRMFGVTSGAVARDIATIRWREHAGARIVAEFQTEMEGRIASRGDRIGLAWPLFGGGDPALLVSAAGRVLTLDRDVAAGPAARSVMLRDDDGSPTGALAATVTGPREVTLTADAPITLRALGGDREPTHVIVATDQLTLDLIVDTVEPQGPRLTQIAARGYLASAYDGTIFAGLET